MMVTSAFVKGQHWHGMSIERVEWHLENWEQMMRRESDDGPDGYERRASSGIVGWVLSRDFDSMVDAVDERCAVATDAVIDSLPIIQRIAVYQEHGIAAAVFRFRAEQLQVYNEAKVTIGRGLTRRGIL